MTSMTAVEYLPTLSTQSIHWGNSERLAHPQWLPVSIDAEGMSNEVITAALRLVIERHESLRAVPVPESRGSWQYLLATDQIPIRLVDIATENNVWRELENRRWPAGEARWFAGIMELPTRKLVIKLCHGLTDQIGLRILASDVRQAMLAVTNGSTPTWKPASSYAELLRYEASVEGRQALRRNSEYFRNNQSPGWIIKPVPERVGATGWYQSALSLTPETVINFSKQARVIGVEWQDLLRAAFFRAEEAVMHHGRLRTGVIIHNREDTFHQRCVANLAVHVPMIVDVREATREDPVTWAKTFSDRYQHGLRQVPVHQDEMWNLTAGRLYGRYPDRMPSLEFETSGTPLIPAPEIPGTGDRAVPARFIEEAKWWPNPITVMLYRRDGRFDISITEHASRATAGTISLLAHCWLGAIEEYIGHDTEAVQRLNEAISLRRIVGRWPMLELHGNSIAIVTQVTSAT